MYMWWRYVHVKAREEFHALELQIPAAVSFLLQVLGTGPRYCARTVHALNHNFLSFFLGLTVLEIVVVLFVFLRQDSLHNPYEPGTQCVDKVCLRLCDLPASPLIGCCRMGVSPPHPALS